MSVAPQAPAAASNVERNRLLEALAGDAPWKKWGPYLSERQWGTVREDYSADGNAWDYFSHDQARSRAYRWGEDGLAGFSDERQILCFALALWNGKDAILKERLFGLTNSEGNHGEDVKEYYFYLDSTPTHSYMKWLYKYPQAAFPYADLLDCNRRRTRDEMEYELLDTGAFDQDRYFDIVVEYAKASPEDILVRISVYNRASEAATVQLLPTLWFRNTWTWNPGTVRPELRQGNAAAGHAIIAARDATLGERWLSCEGWPDLLFTENETNQQRLFRSPNLTPYVKDGIDDYVVHGRDEAVNPARLGTKAAARYKLAIAAGASATIRLRLSDRAPEAAPAPFADFDAVFDARIAEADAFYQSVIPVSLSADERNVMRQALAGMLWGKQYYFFDLDRWLEEHHIHPFQGSLRAVRGRNREWVHMYNDDIISMPDKWEYPWYAAWDLAFHCVPLAMVDIDFAKAQLQLMLRESYMHPTGQIPAYEWNFGDVNPPVHALATLHVYRIEEEQRGRGDVEFLEGSFQKLLLNFTWWVNRKDVEGRNVFQGGFLGLDNIGVFDRSAPLPTGGYLEQADGTAWMALYAQTLLEIALELSEHDPSYAPFVFKFMRQFCWIAASMDRVGEHADEMWDEEDGFFYDVLRLPDGSAARIKVRSMVGLLPLCASTVIPAGFGERFPELVKDARDFLQRQREHIANISPLDRAGVHGHRLLAVVNEDKLRRILSRMLDQERFLSPHGIRSLSRWHLEHPYELVVQGQTHCVQYLPAESNNAMFGGNSNWRGPVWMPVNLLLVRALLQMHVFYGDSFQIECPTGSGRQMNLREVAQEISRRLASIFLRDASGKRPVYGSAAKFQNDPHWRDLILFYEYFHGDNGAGIGASHQTGWTGVVARLMQVFAPKVA